MYKPIKILGVDFEYDPEHMTDSEDEILKLMDYNNISKLRESEYKFDLLNAKYIVITNYDDICVILGSNEEDELKDLIIEIENTPQQYVFLVFKDKKSIPYTYEKTEKVTLG